MNPTNKPHNHDNRPLVTIGQGEYARHLRPSDFDDPPKFNEGASVGLLIIAFFYFVLGFLLGAWLW